MVAVPILSSIAWTILMFIVGKYIFKKDVDWYHRVVFSLIVIIMLVILYMLVKMTGAVLEYVNELESWINTAQNI